MTKQCIKCGCVKPLNEFFFRKDSQKYRNECKKCWLSQSKQFYQKNKEKIKIKTKEYRKQNFQIISKRRKKSYQKNKEDINKKRRIKYHKNPEKIKESSIKYYFKNNEKCIKRGREYYKQNAKRLYRKYKKRRKEKSSQYKIQKRKHEKYRRKNDIRYKLKCNISCLISQKLRRRLLNKNGKSTFSFLPYTLDELMKHLESLFEPWMNWGNWGIGMGYWSIDHIIPDNYFNYISVEDKEFQACQSLENLRPLKWTENIKKGKKLNFEEKQKETLEILNKKFNLLKVE